MTARIANATLLAICSTLLLFVPAAKLRAQPDLRNELWHTMLANELGAAMPLGTDVTVSQVEAGDGADNYRPLYDGKNLTLMSGPTDVSTHAANVARITFGNDSGIAPAVTDINVWHVDHFLGTSESPASNSTSFLKVGQTNSSGVPRIETADVQNNSWVGTFGQTSVNQEAVRRLDYTINRDNYVSVVGVNNGSVTAVPELLAHAYNVVSVGVSSGNHSQGTTTIDGTGRTKPDIVSPYDTTSGATASVSGVAALLVETAGTTDAQNSEVIKAALLSGATKHDFGGWDRTVTRPLDETFGAGQLNAYRSYHIVAADQQQASDTNEVALIGWDFVESPSTNEYLYFFSVDEDQGKVDELSVTLTWNRVVTDGFSDSRFGNLQSSLANLSLELFEASDFVEGDSLQSSNSSVDNVEHLYLEHLDPGQYAIKVSGAAGTDFALAWSGTDYGVAGDVNLDGLVDDADIDAFVAGWGSHDGQGTLESWRAGDMNQDGQTDLQDFLLLREGFNSNPQVNLDLAQLLSTNVAPVPEPSGVVLAASIGTVLWYWARRRRAA